MGHTLYYNYRCEHWNELKEFIGEISSGLGLSLSESNESILVYSPCPKVEPLVIPLRGRGFVKTNKIEPCHSLYKLIIYSLSFFGSLEVWED